MPWLKSTNQPLTPQLDGASSRTPCEHAYTCAEGPHGMHSICICRDQDKAHVHALHGPPLHHGLAPQLTWLPARPQQAYPGTESVHMPAGSSSSHHSRTGSGSNANTFNAFNNPTAAGHSGGGFGGLRGTGPAAGSGVGPEEGEDPFEATRKRIERLKAEGALPEPPPSALPPGLADVPAAGAPVV